MAKTASVWSYVSKMPQERFETLYGGFPHKVRHHLGDWLENQPWEHITTTDTFCIELANSVLTKLVEELEKVPKSCGSDAHLVHTWVENFKTLAQRDPMSIIQSFKTICKGEMEIVLNQFPRLNMVFQSRQEEVMFNFRSKKMQHKLKQTSMAEQALKLAVENVKFHPQVQDLSSHQEKWIFLMKESLAHLSTLQEQTVKRINIWKRQQQMAGNGAPFDENLLPLQDRLEFMFGIYHELYVMVRELKEIDQRLVHQDFFNKINIGFGELIKSSFLVDKQPPQVLKTQTKFQASVNFMLGTRILAGVNKMPVIRASIITEKRAQELCLASASTSESFNDGAGEIENGRSAFEFTQATRTCGAVFKNMLLKKIKRCERKGSESVTEEKCAILFTAEICFNGSTYTIQALSLPVVVIVHGNQDNNAKATILWDNAFSEIGRRPFYVHEKVPWKKMCATLNMKFMSEVGTKQELSVEHFWFLAQKIFGDNCLSYDELKEHSVSWAQFNKEPLRERNFTFWQWFDGVVDLTKKHLKDYWSDGLIMGFVSKQYVHKLLCDTPSGTFLLRFSDSEIGGITIAHVIREKDSPGQIQNIQPFGAKDLQILSLGDRVKDLKQLTYLYKKGRKDDVFKKYYKNVSNCSSGYKKTAIVVKVVGDETEDSQPSWNEPVSMDIIDHTQPSTSSVHYARSPVYASPIGSPVHVPTPQPVYSNPMPSLIQSPQYPIEPAPFHNNSRYMPSPVYPFVDNHSSHWMSQYPSGTSSFNTVDGPQREPDDFSELLKIIENDSNLSMTHFGQPITTDPSPMMEDSNWAN
ncbi:signal transducer and activator of transcription 6 [Dendropsophus ebraccatus]|uniref:signal transducer and activator of transcription 6 n=1 Tax=Dendropsophus ebraccatus TaxID=150705 RepID=UPI003831505C